MASRRVLVAVSIAAVVSCFWPSSPTVAAQGKESIAFLRLTDGFWQLWVMGTDGAGQRQLTRSRVDKVHAAWRPGSSEILYHTNQGRSYLLEPATGQEREILTGLVVTDAAWSPDGQHLAYGLPPEDLVMGKTSLWVSGLDGADRKKVAGGGPIDALAPQWLGQGELLFRQCVTRDNMEVSHEFWRAGLDGTTESWRRLEGDDEPLKFDQVSSTGGFLAYSSARGGAYEVWTLSPAGAARRLTSLGASSGNPSWAPSGELLAFDSDHSGTLQVYRIRSDGQSLKQLTTGAPSRKPVWGPATASGAAVARTETAATATRESPSPTQGDTTPQPSPTAKGGPALSWVSSDRAAFDPASGESVRVRFQVSPPTAVTVRFLDASGEAVRTIRKAVETPGEQVVAWDGRDDAGRPVPPEAYAYTIEARSGASQAIYDLRAQTGGETVWPLEARVDGKGTVSYALPQASRVRLILGRKDTIWPMRTLLDWEPREAGSREEAWDGWDAGHVVSALATPQLVPMLYAFSLPKNAVIVRGSAGSQALARAERRPRARASEPQPPPSRRLHLHARHARNGCYDPRISVSVGGAKTGSGAVRLTEPTPLRFDVEAEQPAGRAAPIPRLSVFVFVDQRAVARHLAGYVPFDWIADPTRLGPGEHLVTAMLVWRDDHYGIAHVKVRVETRAASPAQ